MSDIRPEYKTPEVVTYRDSDILKQMGSLKGLSAPQSFESFKEEPGKRTDRYRGISTRSFLGSPDE